MQIDRTTLAEALAAGARQELEDLVRPYYVDPGELLDANCRHCNQLYRARDASGTLQVFFLVGWHDLLVNDERRQAVFLGLSAGRIETRHAFQMADVFARFRADAITWENHTGRRLLLWFTTATPAVYLGDQHLFAGLAPDRRGAISQELLPVFTALRQQYPDQPNDGHPAVLRGIYGGTRYSPAELTAIDAITRRSGCTVFADLGVSERRGDRLLCVCRTRE